MRLERSLPAVMCCTLLAAGCGSEWQDLRGDGGTGALSVDLDLTVL
jgi:hypothetical protein